jgi:hypothetical protein
MRSRALFIAVLIGLAAPLAAGAGSPARAAAPPEDGQPVKKPQVAPPPSPSGAAAVKRAKAPTARLPVVFAPPKASPIPVDEGDCRLACGQAYYFCLSADEPDSCGGPWTACLTACSRGPTSP